VLTEAVIIE